MDDDGHSCLVEFDANYSNLVEKCFSSEQPDSDPASAAGRALTEPSTEPSTVTARPQGGTRQDFRAKFEAMEKKFRDEFLSTSDTPLAAAPTVSDVTDI